MPKGIPENVPNDGLTTRQRRNRPLLMVHTGENKGKSTAAFGLGLAGELAVRLGAEHLPLAEIEAAALTTVVRMSTRGVA